MTPIACFYVEDPERDPRARDLGAMFWREDQGCHHPEAEPCATCAGTGIVSDPALSVAGLAAKPCHEDASCVARFESEKTMCRTCYGRKTLHRHLIVVIPFLLNKPHVDPKYQRWEWDIDSRASNCTMREDNVHRCWVREGEPPIVTVGKRGRTCAAGAGSIAVTGFHGFLRNGQIVAA